MTPEEAYEKAKDNPNAVEKCQEAACKDPQWAYLFARDVPKINIENCQIAAVKVLNMHIGLQKINRMQILNIV